MADMSAEDLAVYGSVMSETAVRLKSGTERGGPVGDSPEAYMDEVWTIDPGMPGSYQTSMRQQLSNGDMRKSAKVIAYPAQETQPMFGNPVQVPSPRRQPAPPPERQRVAAPPQQVKMVSVLFELQNGETLTVSYAEVIVTATLMTLVVDATVPGVTKYLPVNTSADSACKIEGPQGDMIYMVVPTGFVFRHRQYIYCLLNILKSVAAPDANTETYEDEEDYEDDE